MPPKAVSEPDDWKSIRTHYETVVRAKFENAPKEKQRTAIKYLIERLQQDLEALG